VDGLSEAKTPGPQGRVIPLASKGIAVEEKVGTDGAVPSMGFRWGCRPGCGLQARAQFGTDAFFGRQGLRRISGTAASARRTSAIGAGSGLMFIATLKFW
jgi:hypothetical protein